MKKLTILIIVMLIHTITYAQSEEQTNSSVWPLFPSGQKRGLYSFGGDTAKSYDQSDNLVLYEIKFKQKTCIESFGESHKYGYWDTKGKCVLPPIYDNAYEFLDGLAIVSVCNSDGEIYTSWYIHPNGERLYSSKYNYVWVNHFVGEYAVVDKDGAHHNCHINKKGQLLYSQTYTALYNFNSFGKAIGVRDVRFSDETCTYVVIDTTGREIYTYRGDYNRVSDSIDKESYHFKKLEPYLK